MEIVVETDNLQFLQKQREEFIREGNEMIQKSFNFVA
jgi:hypothetical protein